MKKFLGHPLTQKTRTIVRRVVITAAVILAAAFVTTVTVDLGPTLKARAEAAASDFMDRPMRIGRLSVRLWLGRYVVEDLVTHLDSTHGTLPHPRARAVGGLSQGGHAALQLTFNHPDVFGVAGAHSPSLRPDDGFLPWLGTGAEYARRDPISLAQSLPLATLLRPRLWLDVGTEDQWRPRVEILHQILTERGVPHAWHVGPGSHDGDYWQPNVPTYLRWYGQALRAGLNGL